MNRRISVFLALVLAVVAVGCRTPHAGTVTQVCTIDALLAGAYDGTVSCRELRRYGDFGIGTFAALDGEMILVDGEFFQVRADGRVYQPPLSTTTPFACVTRFTPAWREEITEPLDMAGLEELINETVPQANRFCAFMVRGEFRQIRTRSVPAQTKPYPPLLDVTRNQPVFELQAQSGVLVGFRSPDFVKGVNVPGFHIHYLADDLSSGGHVLAFELTEGTLELDARHPWLKVLLPAAGTDFDAADLTKDRSLELHAVEKETE